VKIAENLRLKLRLMMPQRKKEVAHGTPSTHPQFFPTLRRAPLSQRYIDMKKMMDEVWGYPEEEKEVLDDFADAFTTFFTKQCSPGN
jgi:hypothetical protein